MPTLDTVVLFGTADSTDRQHSQAKTHLRALGDVETYLGTLALLEFDVTLKSRGFRLRREC